MCNKPTKAYDNYKTMQLTVIYYIQYCWIRGQCTLQKMCFVTQHVFVNSILK